MPSPAASLEADDGDRTRDPQLGKVTLDGVKKCHEATKPHAQALRPLRVIQASVDSELPGLIGLEARPFGMPGPDPSFFVSTATRNLRRDTKGDLLGDQLFCAYPHLISRTPTSLHWPTPCRRHRTTFPGARGSVTRFDGAELESFTERSALRRSR
jgi:hypothetical protein